MEKGRRRGFGLLVLREEQLFVVVCILIVYVQAITASDQKVFSQQFSGAKGRMVCGFPVPWLMVIMQMNLALPPASLLGDHQLQMLILLSV